MTLPWPLILSCIVTVSAVIAAYYLSVISRNLVVISHQIAAAYNVQLDIATSSKALEERAVKIQLAAESTTDAVKEASKTGNPVRRII